MRSWWILHFVFFLVGECSVLIKIRDLSYFDDIRAAMVFSGFSVHPRRSRIPLLREWVRRYGLVNATSIGLVGWSDDWEAYYYYGEKMDMNPFSPSILGESCRASEGRDDGDVIQDHMFGRGCGMDEGEWCLFCREVLLLEDPIPQTMEAVVGMVDEMLAFIVHAVAGKGEFVSSDGSKLMELVVVLVRFLILCGGSGVLPYDYSLFRFGGVDPFSGSIVPGSGGRLFALKVMRRLVSLGWCVRNLIRVAWDRAEWVEPDLVESLGLGDKGSVFLCDIWRAVVGTDTSLAVFMQNVVGPSYLAGGPSDLDKGHVVHEYDSTVFASELTDCLSVDEFASALTNCLSVNELAIVAQLAFPPYLSTCLPAISSTYQHRRPWTMDIIILWY